MAQAQIHGVTAASWPNILHHWWQYVLVGLFLVSVGVGLTYILTILFASLFRCFMKQKHKTKSVSTSIKQHLTDLSIKLSRDYPQIRHQKPASFGVYLGALDLQLTDSQRRLLTQWDLLIVDPLQPNMLDTLSCQQFLTPTTFIARIDIRYVAGGEAKESILAASEWVTDVFNPSKKVFGAPGIDGVLISNWEDTFTVALLEEFIQFLGNIGLSVYLETAAPTFLLDPSLAEIGSVTGILIRNGTISRNGEERDTFQMAEMRPTIKAFVSQACLRSFVVLLWETLDQDAKPSNAVLKRCYTWSKFYNALPFIGHEISFVTPETSFRQIEPFGAFDWLKELKVMRSHSIWRSNLSIQQAYLHKYDATLRSLQTLLGLESSLLDEEPKSLMYSCPPRINSQYLEVPKVPSIVGDDGAHSTSSSDDATIKAPISYIELEYLSWLSASERQTGDEISRSCKGLSYDYLGCFPLGSSSTIDAFDNVAMSQERLKKMQLLDSIQVSKLNGIGESLANYCNYLSHRHEELHWQWLATIQDLAQQLCGVSESDKGNIRVHIGLDSGFQVHEQIRFWAVYTLDEYSALDIYLSRNVTDMTGTILHAFLSSRGCPRYQCFEAEISFSNWSGTVIPLSGLSPRIQGDISLLSPSELLQFLQSLFLSLQTTSNSLVENLKKACERQLLDLTDVRQLKVVSTIGFLSNKAHPYDLISSRTTWYSKCNCMHPDEESALEIFNKTQKSVTRFLRDRDIVSLQSLTEILSLILIDGEIDSRVDLIALSVFCAMRKHAFDEAYMEVTDRNTLFNDQSDQAAAFAELFATGARCEAYFDVTPSAFGKLLSDRYRYHHHKPGYEPPLWSEQNPATPSAYAAAKIDIHNNVQKSSMSAHQKFTFLSVFAIPALIDILLLSSTGRGLYLSFKMSSSEVNAATFALMISLLISGAVGTWITCGGTYYMVSMAFSAMNMFIVTRLVTGLAFTLLVGFIGFAVFWTKDGPGAGLVFFLYLIALTSYLCLLAALANFQYTGSAFQSGRPVILLCMPILFISPIITTWIRDKDIYVYTCVIYVFLSMLTLGVRRAGAQWTTWYLDIMRITDQELRAWYVETKLEGNEQSLHSLTDPAVLKLARTVVMLEINKARMSFWKATDPFIQKLAQSYEATVFLLEWYSKYSGTPLPIPFSSTWNMQTKVALQTLRQLQSGVRFHNAFIHWRQAGDEVGCSILYFIVALLDKWTALFAGAQSLGLLSVIPSDPNDYYLWIEQIGVTSGPVDPKSDNRMPVGFALAYYLIGAVLLDFNATKLHAMTAQGQNILIGDVFSVSDAIKREIKARRILYWTMLGRYLLFHVWSLSVSSCLLLVFNGTRDSAILFLAYVGAYTGLLWFQYTKIFAGPRSLKPLLTAVVIGLPLGQLLRHFAGKWPYCDVTTLAVGTWTAAFLSIYYARINGKSNTDNEKSSVEGQHRNDITSKDIYHCLSGHGKDPLLSQDELRTLYNTLDGAADGEKFDLNPYTIPGQEIVSKILVAIETCRNRGGFLSHFALEAFPDAAEFLEHSLSAFESGTITIDCVSESNITFPGIKAVSHCFEGNIQIIMGCDEITISQQFSANTLYQTAVEVLIHHTVEIFLGFSHEDATLAEAIISSLLTDSPVSQRVKDEVITASSTFDLASFTRICNEQALRGISLGYSPDIDWEQLPREIRDLIVQRATSREESPSKSQQQWLSFNKSLNTSARVYIVRCNFAVYVSLSNRKYAKGARTPAAANDPSRSVFHPIPFSEKPRSNWSFTHRGGFLRLKIPFSIIYHSLGIGVKLLALAFVAEPELQRELNFALHLAPKPVRNTVSLVINGIWIYTKALQKIILPLFLFHGRNNVKTLWRRIGGTTVTLLSRQRIAIEDNDGLSTGFIHAPYGSAGNFKIHRYGGSFDREPTDISKLQEVNTYDRGMHLVRKEEYSGGNVINVYKYEYLVKPQRRGRKLLTKHHTSRYPVLRKCVQGKSEFEEHVYNQQGLVERGSYILHGNLIRFSCHYRKDSSNEDGLLRAEFVLPHLTCTVSWSTPPKNHHEKLETWIPSSQVMEANFVLGSDVYESRWIYDHKFHPSILTTLNGFSIETPPIIQYDHLGVLRKPSRFSFADDDYLLQFRSIQNGSFSGWLGLNTKHKSLSTSRARTRLWKAWKDIPGFDGVTVRWLDEMLLRREHSMKRYWTLRDRGLLSSATKFLDNNVEGIMAAVDLDNSISGWTPLAMKISDFYSFGQGGDANSRIRAKDPDFDDGGLQVLAVDSGTWPNEGGGVSACRRDMINNLRSVNWHMIAESANDSGLPKHQTEMNVRSLKVIPLWGLDFLTPTHGLFKDKLDTEVEHVPRDSTKMDIKKNFIPILRALVKGARTSNFSEADVLQTTRALVNLNAYFSESKHWGAVWTSTIVKDAWRNLWVSQDLVSPTPSENWFQTEMPTISQLEGALQLWFRYLFIFSIPLPERIPAIFQASHHSVSAAYGIVCKIKRGCTLQIWDHAISWRETNLYLSSDLSTMAPFMRNALLGLMKLTSHLTLIHADNILPCADFFNPGWEVEIGTSRGTLQHRNIFKRKIDPVVNGIPDMTKFSPIKEITSVKPTVTMLSHVWYAKDIKTAILAADIIVNQWGFKEYRLDIYGAIDKAPTYSTDCFEIIASKSLPNYVVMRGEANPSAVLKKTWVFLNSSISEGLPLALGEAALTGAPVVCTDVGASLRVLTDQETGECYSSVVAPNDARNLARAQINFLALLDEWAPYAEDPEGFAAPTLGDKPTTEEIEIITKRMYEKVEQRKALGMRSREIVQKSFGGERYLREHEQMLWIGKSRYDLQTLPFKANPTSLKLAIDYMPGTVNIWSGNSTSSKPRRLPRSSVQSSILMKNSIEPSVFTSPGIRTLFDSGYGTSSNVSTLPSSVLQGGTPVRKPMPARVTFLRHTFRDSDKYSTGKKLPGEDSFLDDVTAALERI